jgi:hypothetical protein
MPEYTHPMDFTRRRRWAGPVGRPAGQPLTGRHSPAMVRANRD